MNGFRRWALGAALAVLAGPVLAQGFFGRGGGGPGGGGGMLGLLRMEEVRKEVKIDAAQADLIQALTEDQEQKRRRMFEGLRDLSREERERRMEAMRADMEKQQAETDKQLRQVLTPAQVKRLRELDLQQGGTRGLGRKDVQDELKLTADQRSRVQAALEGERAAMRAAFQGFNFGGGGQPPSREQFEAARQKGQEVRTATDAKLNAVLTEPQKKQFQSMQGAPFKFPERRFGPGGPGGPGRPGGQGRRPGGNGANRT